MVRYVFLVLLLSGCVTQPVFTEDGGEPVGGVPLLVCWCKVPLFLLADDVVYTRAALVRQIMDKQGGPHNRIDLEEVYPGLFPCGKPA